MAYVLRTPFVLAASFCVLVPDVALARREPGSAEAPAAAPQPVAPAAAADLSTATTPAATAAAPPVVTPVEAPVVSAPAPAPVVPASATFRDPRPPMPVPDGKRAGALLAAGIGVTASFYLFTSMAGAIAIDKGRKGHLDPATGTRTRDEERIAFGRSLMIPVVGPFLAIGHTDSALTRWGAAMSGLVQVGGAALLVAGLVAKSRVNRARRLGWTAGASSGGAGVMIHGRF